MTAMRCQTFLDAKKHNSIGARLKAYNKLRPDEPSIFKQVHQHGQKCRHAHFVFIHWRGFVPGRSMK